MEKHEPSNCSVEVFEESLRLIEKYSAILQAYFEANQAWPQEIELEKGEMKVPGFANFIGVEWRGSFETREGAFYFTFPTDILIKVKKT